ncbi:helix-turn-helix domain-containing protein [Petrimonas sp.]|uniref:helix-turn-helix domain-containing protein n=1 Tax=Petrimonas sp. TaxID=2023866 RepID=UPI003F519D57
MSKLLYVHEHLQCKNYLSDDKCTFSKYRLNKGELISINSLNQYLFVFLLSGNLELSHTDGRKIKLEAGKMYSLGFDPSILVNLLRDSLIILLAFDRPQILCDEFNLIGLNKYLPKEDSPVRSLPIKEQMTGFLNTMQMYLDNKMLCRHLQGIKQSEFFFIMRGFYTKEENAMFFYPIIEKNNSFKSLVKEKANGAETVKDLAAACNMTTKTLTRKFKESFNETPKQWLLTRKKQQVKIEVLRADNFKELQGKLGFSSYTHLNEYCIKQFDKSVKELRLAENV